MPLRSAAAILGLGLSCILVAGCIDEGTTGVEDFNFPVSRDLSYTGHNEADENIHIYMQGGQRSNANQVLANDVRVGLHTTPYTWESVDDFVNVQFEASNNLGALAFGSVPFTGRQLEQGRRLKVTWSGGSTLAVVVE